jgi:5-methylcytosine-specific restriction endonuclease McrA
MSKQNLDTITREAIWNAHKQRCFYCRKHVLFADVEIDHFIPESISQEKFDGLVQRGVLAENFNVLSEENFVPTCSSDNGRKNDLVFNDNFLALNVEVIAKKAQKARKELSRKRKLYSLDMLLRKVLHGIDQGSYTANDVRDYMDKLSAIPPSSYFLGVDVPPREPQILFTDRAEKALRQGRMSIEKLWSALANSARHQKMKAVEEGGNINTYVLRLDSHRQIVFRRDGEYILILDYLLHRKYS